MFYFNYYENMVTIVTKMILPGFKNPPREKYKNQSGVISNFLLICVF